MLLLLVHLICAWILLSQQQIQLCFLASESSEMVLLSLPTLGCMSSPVATWDVPHWLLHSHIKAFSPALCCPRCVQWVCLPFDTLFYGLGDLAGSCTTFTTIWEENKVQSIVHRLQNISAPYGSGRKYFSKQGRLSTVKKLTFQAPSISFRDSKK